MSKKTAASPALVACAHDLADAAAAVTLPYFRSHLEVDDKATNAPFDPVTEADRAAERAVSEVLAERFPRHGLEGEEYGVRQPEAPMRWIVDPIDGTRAFITGSPMWGTLIGLTNAGVPILGMMDQPFTGERFWSNGETAVMRRLGGNEVAIRTRACAGLADAVFMTTDPALFRSQRERSALEILRSSARLTRYGGDCYAYAMMASGFVDVIVECGLGRYDIVPLIPVIEAAGGRVSTWDGEPATSGGNIVACGDPQLHRAVLDILAP